MLTSLHKFVIRVALPTIPALTISAQEVVVWSQAPITGQPIPAYDFPCWTPHVQFISAVGCGDFDGDGVEDNLISRNFGHYSYVGGHIDCVFFGYPGGGNYSTLRSSGVGMELRIHRDAFPAGDVNGDGFADVFGGDGTTGRLIAGPGGLDVFALEPPETFAEAVAIGDVNADGRDDIGIPDGADFEFRSGRDLSILATLPNVGVFSRAGDANQDGHDDVLVVAPDAAYVLVISGTDRSILRAISTPFSERLAAAELGDLNADGFDDLAIQQDSTLTVHSGADGSTLLQGPIQLTSRDSVFLRDTLQRVSDFDGDGVHDVLAGAGVYSGLNLAPLWIARPVDMLMSVAADSNENGRSEVLVRRNVFSLLPIELGIGEHYLAGVGSLVDVIELAGSPAARAYVRYAGCEGSNGSIPRIDVRGLPRLGQPMHLRLEGGRPHGSIALHFGSSLPVPFDLQVLGADRCLITTNPFVTIRVPSDGAGFVSLPLTLPVGAAPPGFEYSAQWLILDPGANALGLTTSGELRLRVAD